MIDYITGGMFISLFLMGLLLLAKPGILVESLVLGNKRLRSLLILPTIASLGTALFFILRDK